MVKRTPRPLQIGIPAPQLAGSDPVRAARRAEEVGIDSMWWADRLAGWMPEGPHSLLDPFPAMAVAGQATSVLKLGTAVADPLRRHPAQLAQTALTVQELTTGRLILGVGCGEAAGTIPYGIPFTSPASRLEEALEVIRLLWRDGGPVDFEGVHYRLEGARCGLAASVDAPPIWIASHGPRMLTLTGSVADGWLPTACGPVTYATQLASIREAERVAGRPEGAVEAGAFVWLVAAKDRAHARKLMHTEGLRALGLLLPKGVLASSPLAAGPSRDLLADERVAGLARMVDPEELATVLPHGSPDDIAEDLQRYRDAGAEHLVLCDMGPLAGVDTQLGMRPLDLYGTLRDALAS